MSPSMCWTRDASCTCSKKLGSVGGGSEKPATSASRERSHSDSHPPLKPVWPVTRTRRPFHSEFLTSISTELPSATAHPGEPCPATCPSRPKNRYDGRQQVHP